MAWRALGDDLIQSNSRDIARCLSDACQREDDLVARYGGEEFAVLMPMTDLRGATRIAWAIQEKLRLKALPHRASSVSEVVTVSVGLASMVVQDTGVMPKDLVREADRNLYAAKTTGRNKIVSNTEAPPMFGDSESDQQTSMRLAG